MENGIAVPSSWHNNTSLIVKSSWYVGRYFVL
jgi:hypothetical protein